MSRENRNERLGLPRKASVQEQDEWLVKNAKDPKVRQSAQKRLEKYQKQ